MDDTPAPPTAVSTTHFKTHFVESVMLTWVGNVGRMVIGLVALRLVTDAIPEADLGAYWILTSVAALLSNFAELGLGLAVVRHLPLAPDPAQARRLMQTASALRLAVLALLCLLIAACRPGVLRLFSAESIESRYFYLYIFVVVNSLYDLYTNFLQGLNRFRIIAVYALVSSVARLVLIVALVRGLGLQVQGLFIAEVLALVLSAALSAASSRLGWRPRLDRAQATWQLRFGFPLYLNMLLSYTGTRLNTLLIGGIEGPAAVSYFSVASRIPDQLLLVQRSYNFVFLPNMSRLLAAPDDGPARRLLAASLRVMGFSFAFLALALGLMRHELLSVLAPPSYQVASLVVPLLLGGLAFGALGNVLGNTLVASGDSRTPFWINFWTTPVSVVLNLVCITKWGLLGAGWASFLFNALGWVVTDLVVSRRIRPAGRGYVGIFVLMAVAMVAGLEAGIWVRVAIVVVAAAGSLLLSAPLRADILQIWSSGVRSRLRAKS